MTPVVRKIPEPMVIPMTRKVESSRPSPRTSLALPSSVVFRFIRTIGPAGPGVLRRYDAGPQFKILSISSKAF